MCAHLLFACTPSGPGVSRADYKATTRGQRHLSARLIRQGKGAPTCGTLKHSPQRVCFRTSAALVSIVSLLTISRAISLSFQSAFHLSLTVLVKRETIETSAADVLKQTLWGLCLSVPQVGAPFPWRIR